MLPPSSLEQLFFALWTRMDGGGRRPQFVREFEFALPERRWRFDFAWPVELVAVELQGGSSIIGKSRHTRPAGYQKDLEKFREAQRRGWIVLPFAAADLRQRPVQTIEEVERTLALREGVASSE